MKLRIWFEGTKLLEALVQLTLIVAFGRLGSSNIETLEMLYTVGLESGLDLGVCE